MPCKNASSFIDECITSILNQNYQNWELLVCDDGSTDNSWDLLKNWSAIDNRIKVDQNQGNGIIEALCNGYKNSKGFFVTRMDADDVMPANKLKTLLELLIDDPTNKVATGKVSYFPEKEIQSGYKKYQNWLNALVDNNNHWQEIYKECVIASPCWMMEKESFEAIGGFEGGNYPEDYDLVWRMFINSIQVVVSKEILHLWRDHSQRTSRNSEVYQNQTYFDLKIKYMLSLPQIKDKKILIWGAGKKGKSLVKIIQAKGIQPIWVCNNPNKIGHTIFGIKLQDFRTLKHNDSKTAVLLTVSANVEDKEIQQFLTTKNYFKSIDFFSLA